MKRRKKLKDLLHRNSEQLQTKSDSQKNPVSGEKGRADIANNLEIGMRRIEDANTVASSQLRAETLGDLQRNYGNKLVNDALGNRAESDASHELIAKKERGSTGEALPDAVKTEMEKQLGKGLDDVKIHKDSSANESAKLLRAKAYTRRSDIYFGKGHYAPETVEGKETLAHELAHVIQTKGQSGAQSSRFERVDSELERDAHQVANQIAQGKQAGPRAHASPSGVLRKEEEKEKETVPTIASHGQEITPAHKRGTINAGSFSVEFIYDVSETDATLALHVPDGVEASFGAMGGMPEGGFKINDPGGAKARTIRIVMPLGSESVPRMRAMFSQQSATYIVIFQFPV